MIKTVVSWGVLTTGLTTDPNHANHKANQGLTRTNHGLTTD